MLRFSVCVLEKKSVLLHWLDFLQSWEPPKTINADGAGKETGGYPL